MSRAIFRVDVNLLSRIFFINLCVLTIGVTLLPKVEIPLILFRFCSGETLADALVSDRFLYPLFTTPRQQRAVILMISLSAYSIGNYRA